MKVIIALSLLVLCVSGAENVSKKGSLTEGGPIPESLNPISDASGFFYSVSSLFEQITIPAGYPTEVHYVESSDGYILVLFRIPGKKNESPDSYRDAHRPPVFLQHGLLDSSDAWICNGENSIAFILANAGYDVWLGNIRGNKYSLYGNEGMSYQQSSFWDFTWNEMAQYDLPAMIEYTTEFTNYNKVIYAGHSQGTVIMWAGLAEPSTTEYLNSKIALFIAMGPAVYVHNTSAELLTLSSDIDLGSILADFDIHEFLLPTPWGVLPSALVSELCDVTEIFCDGGLYLITSEDPAVTNQTQLPIYMAHFPAGTSVRNMEMWSQQVSTDKFQKYDFGSSSANEAAYGTSTPPLYDWANVKVPTAMFVGEYDRLADPTDCAHLKSELDAAGDSLVYYQEWPLGHLAFLLADDMDYWTEAMTLIEQHQSVLVYGGNSDTDE